MHQNPPLQDSTPPSVSRRKVLAIAAATPVAAAMTSGCGGFLFGKGSSGGATTGPLTQSASGTLALPASFAGRELKLMTAYSETSAADGPFTATITVGSPTIVNVIDPNTSELLFFGMVDPAQSTNVLDTQNLAATMLFILFGGAMYGEKRGELFNALKAHPATATLSGVLATKLAVDAAALNKADSDIKNALEAAATIIGLEPLATGSKSSSRTRETFRPLEPPRPAVEVWNLANEFSGPISLSMAKTTDGKNERPDILRLTREGTRVATALRYQDPGGTPVTQVSGIYTFSEGDLASSSVGNETKDLAATMLDPTRDAEFHRMVVLSPNFFTETTSEIPSSYSAEEARFNSILRELAGGVVARLAGRMMIDALGFSPGAFNSETLDAYTARLNQSNAAFQGFQTSVSATSELAPQLDGYTALATSNVPNAQSVIDALRPMMPGGFSSASALYLIQLQGALKVYSLTGMNDIASRFAGWISLYQSTKDRNFGSVFFTTQIQIYRLKFTIEGSQSDYKPGDSITLNFKSDPEDHFTKYGSQLKFKVKLFGGGDATLDDGAGNVGREFETTKTTLTLKTTANSTGVQSVSIDVINTTNGPDWSAGTPKFDIGEPDSTEFGVSEVLGLRAGKAATTSVSYRGTINMESWEDVPIDRLRFTWEIESSDQFWILNGTSKVTSFVSSTNSCRFETNPQTQYGETVTYRVTVAKVEPGTGAFTNLAVLNGGVKIELQGGAQMLVLNPSFPLSALREPNVIHNLGKAGRNSGTGDPGAFYYAGFGSVEGTPDFIYTLIWTATTKSLQVGDGFNSTDDGTYGKTYSRLGLSAAALGGGMIDFKVTFGSWTILEVTKDINGNVTSYICRASFQCTSIYDSGPYKDWTFQAEVYFEW